MNNNIINDLIKKYGSPLYIYDYNILESRVNQIVNFKNSLESKLNDIKVSMHYSLKANSNPAILKVVKDGGINVDSMSPLELDICKKCGFNKNQILYVCNNIDDEEMKLVHDEDILICLDSISQIETWGKLYPNSNIMVRINPGKGGVGHSKKVITSGKETKFGVSEENFEELLNTINRYNLNLVGIHQHLGSLFLNDKINDYIEGVKSGLSLINKYFPNIRIIDLGGGFGVPYKPNEEDLDFDIVADELIKVLNEFLSTNSKIKEIKFEPGRFIVCESGIIAGKVNAIKNENNTWWIGTDIGMNELVRPSMYNAYHKIKVLSDNKNIITANVCGNICESGDILGKNISLPMPKINDIIIVKNAGAYGFSMASNYTGRPRPAEIMVSDSKIKLIRKRETIEFLESTIVWE